MNKDEFINEVSKLGISLDNDKLDKLDRYYKLLVEWNEKINLTRIIVEKDVYLKHFYDSLTLYRDINLCQNLSICDIGTGAGFPGMVLKIVFPNLKVTLVDSLLKRVNFLKLVIKELNLSNIEVYHARGEDFMLDYSNKFDVVTSRAVSNLYDLSCMCLPLVKKNGFFIPLKANCDDEIKKSLSIIKKMDSEIEKIDKFYLPFEESKRTIIKIVKRKETSKNRINLLRKLK